MKRIITLLSIAAVALAVSTSANAADKKKPDLSEKRTINGIGVCGKCKLGTSDKCNNVLQRMFKGKDGKMDDLRNFVLADNDVAKAAHGKFFCKGETPVKVTGVVHHEGEGKDLVRIMTATKIEAGKAKKAKKKDS